MFGRQNAAILPGASQIGNNFVGLEYLHILRGKNDIMDKLAKLNSSRAIVPIGAFL
jgi:hypothetical protein